MAPASALAIVALGDWHLGRGDWESAARVYRQAVEAVPANVEGYLALGLLFVLLLFIEAPYGRHSRGGWGPRVPARLAWTLFDDKITQRSPDITVQRGLNRNILDPQALKFLTEFIGVPDHQFV